MEVTQNSTAMLLWNQWFWTYWNTLCVFLNSITPWWKNCSPKPPNIIYIQETAHLQILAHGIDGPTSCEPQQLKNPAIAVVFRRVQSAAAATFRRIHGKSIVCVWGRLAKLRRTNQSQINISSLGADLCVFCVCLCRCCVYGCVSAPTRDTCFSCIHAHRDTESKYIIIAKHKANGWLQTDTRYYFLWQQII